MNREKTKAYFDARVFFLDQKDFTVYDGQRAHFHGCPRFGGIPEQLGPEAIVRFIGIDGVILKMNDGEEQEFPVKEAPAHWRDAGISWARARHGCVYEELPAGNLEEESPPYRADEDGALI